MPKCAKFSPVSGEGIICPLVVWMKYSTCIQLVFSDFERQTGSSLLYATHRKRDNWFNLQFARESRCVDSKALKNYKCSSLDGYKRPPFSLKNQYIQLSIDVLTVTKHLELSIQTFLILEIPEIHFIILK